MRALACAVMLALGALATGALAQDGQTAAATETEVVPEPEGYRMEAYRAPVPATLSGAETVDLTAAHQLWQAGEVAFIDVLPRPERPANLPEGTIWHDKPRDSLPGAIWLPNTGFGALPPEMETYLQAGLAAQGDRPLLFFCLRDCWQSWNAAKRALSMGFGPVYWMPDGSDGWAEAGYPLERVMPFEAP